MRLPLLVIAGALLPALSQAAEVTSVVTRYRDACKLTGKLAQSGDEYYACPGYGGIAVEILAGHDSDRVSFGPKARDECAWSQGFVAYSTPAPSIEWRVKDGEAVAAIQTWSVSRNGANDQWDDWLVVTRLGTGRTCRIAVVQASLPDATEAARKRADERAASFDCRADMIDVVADVRTATAELLNGYRCGEP